MGALDITLIRRMNQRMDQLAAMRVFVAVAEQRGFAAAARKLGLSQPSVTRLVAALEAHVATALFQRTTRATSLTDAGARYLESARRILAELAEADAVAQADRTAPAGRLVVAAPLGLGRAAVAPLFGDFLRAHPQLSGGLVLSDRVVSLVEEGVDLAVRIGQLDDSSLRVRQLGHVRRVLVASPGYLRARGLPRSPRDLGGHDLIQFTSLTPLAEWSFARRGASFSVPVTPRLSTNSADAAVAHAERDGGIALVLSYQVAEAVRGGRLRVVLARHEPAPSPVQVVYHAAQRPRASVRAFIDWLVARGRWDFRNLRR